MGQQAAVDDKDNFTMGEFFNDVRDARKEQKKKYQETEMSDEIAWIRSFGFRIDEHNGGGHLAIYVITDRGERIVDYWPETGKWKLRQGRAEGRYIRNLVRYFKIGDGNRPTKKQEDNNVGPNN